MVKEPEANFADVRRALLGPRGCSPKDLGRHVGPGNYLEDTTSQDRSESRQSSAPSSKECRLDASRNRGLHRNAQASQIGCAKTA